MPDPNQYVDPNFNPNMPPAGFVPGYGSPMPGAPGQGAYPDPSMFSPGGMPYGAPSGAVPGAVAGMPGMPPMGQPMPGQGFSPDMGMGGSPMPDFGSMGQMPTMPTPDGQYAASASQPGTQVPSSAFVEEPFSVEGMASPQDIYSHQAAASAQAAPAAHPNSGFVDSTFPGGMPFTPDVYGQGVPATSDVPMQSQFSGQQWQPEAQIPNPATGAFDPTAGIFDPTASIDMPSGTSAQFQQDAQWHPDMAHMGDASVPATPDATSPSEPFQGMPDMQFTQAAPQFVPEMEQFAPEQFSDQMYYQQFDGVEQPNFYDNVIIEPIDSSAATPGKATLSLILGILSIIFVAIPPIGIILGAIARRIGKNYKHNGGQKGTGSIGSILGLIGLILSIISCVVLIVIIALMAGASFGSGLAGSLIQFYNSTPLASIAAIPYSYF